MTRTPRIVRFGSFTSDKIVRIQRGMSASPPTHRRAGHKDRCSVLTRLTPWPFAMKTPSQWGRGDAMLTSPECRARAEHYTSIRQQESRRGHGIVAIRVSIGLMVVHYLSSTAIQYQRPLRMLTAIPRGCESVDFGDFDTSAFSADLGQARDRWPGTSG